MNFLNATFSINRLQVVQEFAPNIFFRKTIFSLTTQHVVYLKEDLFLLSLIGTQNVFAEERSCAILVLSLTVALKGEMLYFVEKHKLMIVTLREMPKPANPRDQ